RQVFVSRWAHVNGRHAWVEAWANGRWHFIGACEPEPLLDLGWFNQAAARGMMMKTRVFGYYRGVEETLDTAAMFTAINVTANYTATARQRVRVVDKKGNPIKGARVRYCIYSNGEFYAFNDLETNEDGIASVQTGIGDMVAWAKKDDKFQFAKVKSGTLCEMTLDLDNTSEVERNFDIVPPLAYSSTPVVSDEMREENNRRLAQEDSIREAYVATFYDLRKATSLAIKINAYPSKIANIMGDARGNWPVIEEFLLKHQDDSDKAVALLESLTEKDLNDITLESLDDHFDTPYVDTELYQKYILNPRVANERISPYKHALSSALKDICPDGKTLANWVRENIETDSIYNMEQLPMLPAGVLKRKKAGWHAKEIFFVAAARSLGIPARIDPVTGNVQYHDSTRWVNVKFTREIHRLNPAGKLRLVPNAQNTVSNANYYTYFTLSRIEDGIPRLLSYPEDYTAESFANGVELENGQYLLVTGERLLKGGVKAHATLFHVKPGETTDVPFVIRLDPLGIQAFGSFDSNNSFIPLGTKNIVTISSHVGSGCYIAGFIDPRTEPSMRALADLSSSAEALDKAGFKILLLMPEEAAETFNPATYPSLPKCVTFGIDPNGNIYNLEIEMNLSAESPSMPTFVLADTFNRALWIKRGYTPGLGKKIAKVLSTLNQ
ncbi:MAG: hypothetical protein NC102_10905, partial [Clostridium sp.]|nr:hypothetical protein [Clostridium sp.]